MLNKAKPLLENCKPELSRNYKNTSPMSTKCLEKTRPIRLDKSPVSSQRMTVNRILGKSPENGISRFLTNRTQKTPQINKNSSFLMQKQKINHNDFSKVGKKTSILQVLSTKVTSEEFIREKIQNSDCVEIELSEALKIYNSGFSEFQNSCVSNFCVNHTDKKTEFFSKMGQLFVGFCAICAVKYAGMSMSVNVFAAVKPTLTKKVKIEQFMSQIKTAKRLLVEKRVELLHTQSEQSGSTDEELRKVEQLFDNLIRSFQQQKLGFHENLKLFFANRKRETEERIQILTQQTNLVEKIESDIYDNYDNILENVDPEDFEVILSHHQSQFAQNVRQVEQRTCPTPNIITEVELQRVGDKIKETFDAEMRKIYPRVSQTGKHCSIPTFKNFSPQNQEKRIIEKENGGVGISQVQTRHFTVCTEPDSAFKNIPSIENFMEINLNSEFRKESMSSLKKDKFGSTDEFSTTKITGNCFSRNSKEDI